MDVNEIGELQKIREMLGEAQWRLQRLAFPHLSSYETLKRPWCECPPPFDRQNSDPPDNMCPECGGNR